MSTEAARAFVERLREDEALRGRMAQAEDDHLRQQLVHTEGYDCTLEEAASHARRLSDAELEQVAAGGGYCGSLDGAPCSSGLAGLAGICSFDR